MSSYPYLPVKSVIDGPLLRAYDAFIEQRKAEIIKVGFTADDIIELARLMEKDHKLAAAIALDLNQTKSWHMVPEVHLHAHLLAIRADRALTQAIEDFGT